MNLKLFFSGGSGLPDGAGKREEVHASGAERFERPGGLIGRGTGGENIVHKKKRAAGDSLGMPYFKGAVDIDRPLFVVQERLAGNGMFFDQERSGERRGQLGAEKIRQNFGLVEVSFQKFQAVDRDREDRVIRAVGGDGLRKRKGRAAASFEQMVFSRVFDGVQKFFEGRTVGINGPDMIQRFESLFDPRLLEWPGEAVQGPGAILAENLLFEREHPGTEGANRRIEKPDESFFVLTEHK